MIHSNTGVIISIDTGIFDSFKIKTEQEKRTVIHICKSVRNSFSLLLFLIYHQTNIFSFEKKKRRSLFTEIHIKTRWEQRERKNI